MFHKEQIAIPNVDSLHHDVVYTIDALVEDGLAVHRAIFDNEYNITFGDFVVTHIESGMILASNLTYTGARKYVQVFNAGLTENATVDIIYSNRLKRYIYKPSPEYGRLHNEALKHLYRP